MTFQVHRRDGLYSLRKTATELCRLIVAFSPVIERLYPANETLRIALEAALVACQALSVAVEDQKEVGV